MRIASLCLSLALAASLAVPAKAQSPGSPGVVTGGANGVTFNGKPAARQGDTTSDGSLILEGSPNVFINGKPAARTGDQTSGCPK